MMIQAENRILTEVFLQKPINNERKNDFQTSVVENLNINFQIITITLGI